MTAEPVSRLSDLTARLDHARIAARLLTTVEKASDLVTLHDLDGRAIWINDTVRRLFGLSPDDPIPPILPTDFLDISLHQLMEIRNALELDGEWHGEHDVLLPNGERVPASIAVVAQRDAKGNIECFSAVTRDIADRKKFEEALRTSEVRYRSLVQYSSDVLLVIDAEWNVLHASPSACEFFGLGSEQMLNRTVPWQLHPDDDAKVMSSLGQVKDHPGLHRSIEFRVLREDGSQRWLEMVATNLLHDPAVGGIVTNSRDVTERKIAEGALLASESRVRENEARYRAVLDDQTELVVRYLPDTTIIFVNRAFAEFYGRKPEELVGTRMIEMYPPEQRDAELARLAAFGAGNDVQWEEEWELRADGRICWYRWTDRAFLGRDGKPREFQSVGYDITDQRRAAQLTKRQADLLEQVARGIPLLETLASLARTVEEQFPSLRCAVMLLDDDGVTLRNAASPNLPAAYVEAVDGIEAGPDSAACGTAVHRREPVFTRDVAGDPRWAEFRDLALEHGLRACWSVPILTYNGARVLGTFAVYARTPGDPPPELLELLELLTHVAAIAVEHKEFEDRLAHQSMHDPLTDLPNRALFLDRLALALVRSRRTRRSVAVLFLDLDRFKNVNDSLGHEAGDELLVAIARRLEGALRPGDTVARFGGDEFTVLCEDLPTEHARERAGEIASRLFGALAAPFGLNGAETFLGASVGIAVASEGTERPEELLRDADAAMYHAKEQGRGRYEIFDDAMRARALERHATENALHFAIERGEFRLFFQPVVSIGTGRCVGAEALVRWAHPERGLVSPDEFVGLAEETGLIVALGAWVLEEAAKQAAVWQREGAEPFLVSVNLSARQLAQPDLVESVASVLTAASVDPSNICVEITESVLMDDAAATLAVIERLRALGVRLSIDDFGTGYSSLGYLKRFPVDTVKIDRSFVDGLGVDAGDTAIVSAVVGLAHALGLRVVAEGVETAEQLQALATLGCDEAQGFLFSPPQPAAPRREFARLAEASMRGPRPWVGRRIGMSRRLRRLGRQSAAVRPFTEP